MTAPLAQAATQQSWLKRGIARLAESDANHHANFSKWTMLIIWACSLVAEVGTFACNEKLPRREKGFIIRQELCAGGISLGIMWFLSHRFQKFGEKLVERGTLLPKAVRSELHQTLSTASGLLKNASLKAAIPKILAGEAEITQTVGKNLGAKIIGFRNGVGLLSMITGTIIASNICAPLISNAVASYFFNRKQKMTAQSAPPQLAPTVQPNPPFPDYFSYTGQRNELGPWPLMNAGTSPANLAKDGFPQSKAFQATSGVLQREVKPGNRYHSPAYAAQPMAFSFPAGRY